MCKKLHTLGIEYVPVLQRGFRMGLRNNREIDKTMDGSWFIEDIQDSWRHLRVCLAKKENKLLQRTCGLTPRIRELAKKVEQKHRL